MAQEMQEHGNTQEQGGTITISSGSSSIQHNGAGKSVSDLRNQLKKVLNIGSDTRVLVNGALIQDESTFVVQAGMHVEFVKAAGQKGSC